MSPMNPNADLYRKTRRAAAWGIGLSLTLGLVKFFGGFFGHSLALLSDAAHSLIDALISFGLMGALVVAERPADHEHPYGHGRLEAVAGALVAVLLMLLAAGIAWEAIATLSETRHIPHTFTLVISIAAALFQEGLYRYPSLVANESGSGALMATAWEVSSWSSEYRSRNGAAHGGSGATTSPRSSSRQPSSGSPYAYFEIIPMT
jgi:cation diffusion facilitator family transporter